MAGSISSNYSDDGAPMSSINVTPLVDVVLVLLIVFMITVPAIVASAPVKVDLPDSKSIASAAAEQMPMIFSLKRGADDALELYLNERLVDEAEIKSMFADAPPSDDQQISLAADQGIPYGEVVRIMDLLQSVGLKKLSLETRHVE
jgi:biopolymer transport protein ExbD